MLPLARCRPVSTAYHGSVVIARRYRPHLTAEVSLGELEASDEAVGAGPGIDAQRRRAQLDKAEVLLERRA